ncbi:putative EBP domain protein [Globomyces pollinis-pini]|nr:putative EBP domain protein [Globomyces pollinis-pini]
MPKHPFFPTDLVIPHYASPLHNTLDLLIPAFSVQVILICFGLILVVSLKPSLSNSKAASRTVFLWFLSSGFIHVFLESYFLINHQSIAGQTTFLADLWKEYAKSDSRYMTSDPFVLIAEGITITVLGPLCFITCLLIYRDSPSRHLLQFSISLCHFYGCVLYFLTTLIEDAKHCTPSAYYFYFYFVFMNSLWIIFPAMIMYSSGSQIVASLALAKKEELALTNKKRK